MKKIVSGMQNKQWFADSAGESSIQTKIEIFKHKLQNIKKNLKS